jgi:hypothetical protein
MSAIMGLAIMAVVRWLPAVLTFGKLLNSLLLVGVGGGLGLAVYFACGALLGQEEIMMLWNRARTRLFIRG